jgi:putative transposase
MNTHLNSIIKWTNSGRSERVLCLHPAGQHYYCIDIKQKSAWPILRACADVDVALKESRAIIMEHDQLAASLQTEHAPTDQQRRMRDKAWEAIQYLVLDEQRAVMDLEKSDSLIRAAARRANLHRTTIYKYLRRYWQCGQTIHALQPNVPRLVSIKEKMASE